MRYESFDGLERIIAADPGRRGIAGLIQAGDLASASRSLLSASRVGIATGFFIPAAGSCETDGPPGALALGCALHLLDISAVYLTDTACRPVLTEAALEPLICFPNDDVWQESPSHLVAVERAGRAKDGQYYNMRAADITASTGSVDEIFLQASDRGIPTVGIGDGGNEIGMGKVYGRIAESVPHGASIGSIVATDSLIVAGTSNWGAWGLVAGLSLCAGQNLLPSPEHARTHLDRCVAAGAVDGVTALQQPTVDGLDWPTYIDILAQLHRLVDKAVR